MSTKLLFTARLPLTRLLMGMRRYESSKLMMLHTTAVQGSEDSKAHIKIDDSAVKQLSRVAGDGSFLRISVEGGGCSGFQYKFELDDKITDEDRVFEQGGQKIVVDDMSLDLINGSTIMFEESLMSSAFQVAKNPQADAGCSCGVSFSLKL